MSRNVPPASTKRSSIRWDSSTGVLLPISMVPRQRRVTVRGPSEAVSIYPTVVARGSVNVLAVAGRPGRGGTFVRAR